MQKNPLGVTEQRRLGPFQVSAIGLGCMNLSHAYGAPPTPEAAAGVLRRALELGVNHFDTAALYGYGANEELIGRTLAPRRSEFVLATKGGMFGIKTETGYRRVIDGRPNTLKTNCEDSLRRLRTDVIDVYYLHRCDKQVPIEESVGAMADLQRQGKIRALGLSEVSATTLRRANAVHPIAAVQTEYSLCTRNPEIAVLAACRELGVSFVAFSPLSRAFLTGALTDTATLHAQDLRRKMPRFAPENYSHNLGLLGGFMGLARITGCSPAQLAIAWVLSRGANVLAIPGTTSDRHLAENVGAGSLTLGSDIIARLDSLINERTVFGERYNGATQAEIDTENF